MGVWRGSCREWSLWLPCLAPRTYEEWSSALEQWMSSRAEYKALSPSENMFSGNVTFGPHSSVHIKLSHTDCMHRVLQAPCHHAPPTLVICCSPATPRKRPSAF